MVDYLDEFKLFLNEDNSNNDDDNDNENKKKFIEDKDIYDIVDNESVFTINSKDRNLINETAFNFSINFGTNNPNKINIGKNFKNIVEVEFLGLIIPDFYVDIKEIITLDKKSLINYVTGGNTTRKLKLKRISDLPYLLLNITELKNTNSMGSDQAINNSSYVLVLDEIRDMSDNNSGTLGLDNNLKVIDNNIFFFNNGDNFTEQGNLDQTIIGETPKRNLYFKSFTTPSIKYSNPQNYLGNIQVSLRTPQGELLKNLNDFLDVYRVYKFGDGTAENPYRLRVKFYNFFSADEFRIGDRILFKDLGYPVDESLHYNEENVINIIIADGYTTSDSISERVPKFKLLYDNIGFTNPNYLDRYSQIIQFLEREEGHSIYEVVGNNNNSKKLFTEIGIPFDSQIPLDIETNNQGEIITNTLDMVDTASGILHQGIPDGTDSSSMYLTFDTMVNISSISVNDIIDCVGIDKGSSRQFTTSLRDIDEILSATTLIATNHGQTTLNGVDVLKITMDTTQSKTIPAGTLITFHKPWNKEDSFDNPTSFNDPTYNIVFAQGKCINLSNQTTLGLKIRNKEKQIKSVKTELL